MSHHPIKLAFGVLFTSLAACGAASAQTAVLDQIGSNPSVFTANGYESQINTDAAYVSSSTALLDDFTVSDPSLLHLTSVQAVFTLPTNTFFHPTTANIQGWEVNVYTTKPGAGSMIAGTYTQTIAPASVTYTAPYGSANGSNLVTIPTDLTLASTGTYYISIVALNNFETNQTVYMDLTNGSFFGGGNSFNFTPTPAPPFGQYITAHTADAAYRIFAGGPAAVPEPGTWALLAAGGLTLAAAGARRRSCAVSVQLV